MSTNATEYRPSGPRSNRSRRGPRQGGKRPQKRNNNNQRNSGNRRHYRSKMPRPKEPTGWEKFLYFITFGALGKKSLQAPKEANNNQRKGPKPNQNNKVGTGTPAKKRSKRPRKKTEVTSGRLYVGNLSYDTNEADLEELFNGVGSVVSTEVICHRRTQRSKGYAFVEMQSKEEAIRAVEELHDKEYMGRKLLVSGARQDPNRGKETA